MTDVLTQDTIKEIPKIHTAPIIIFPTAFVKILSDRNYKNPEATAKPNPFLQRLLWLTLFSYRMFTSFYQILEQPRTFHLLLALHPLPSPTKPSFPTRITENSPEFFSSPINIGTPPRRLFLMLLLFWVPFHFLFGHSLTWSVHLVWSLPLDNQSKCYNS